MPSGSNHGSTGRGPDHHDLRHHGDSEVGPGLVDLAVNVRQGMPPKWLREILVTSLSEISAYPNAERATRIVAEHHGRVPEEVLLTVGAAEAFTLLARVLSMGRPGHEPAAVREFSTGRPDADGAATSRVLPVLRPVVVHPQFTEPEAALRAVGFNPGRVLLPDPFVLNASLIPDDADLVMIGNPTNPTSVLHPAETIASLAREGRYLVVDEAFADCVPGEPESLASARLPGLVVIRSLTKTWGLAGLRIGYVIGPPELIAAMREAQPLWAVSTPALAAAEACVSPRAQAESFKWAEEMAGQRQALIDGLTDLGAYVVPDPQASFVCVRLPHALHLRTLLRARGFAVRRADTFPGLGPEWLRVAVRDDETTAAFLAALKEARDDQPA
ncbi:Rv2231c family pyridoxal phosphate-dependent protein CobC [Herbidospora mongoliensis]|uniref:Rv2231c family pyridoxal phosphate-dependent protein CobC n=1 Tax=Herbidospora mongoliensis TaxID=688067 RepID=UPI00082E8F00|nr:Rv2231c family pyridoxal phosphate-dependent protein CobC [Herbidospora mongoliensis]